MANSDANYGNPVKWGNVKKIEVSQQVFESLFFQLKNIDKQLENIRVSISNITSEKDKEISKLKLEIETLHTTLKEFNNK